MKFIIIALFIIITITNVVNSDYSKKYHDGEIDSYSSKREDSNLEMDSGFNSFSSNKPPPTIFEQIANRLFYHNDNFNEITDSIYQFGDFVDNLKNGGIKNTLNTIRNNNKKIRKGDINSNSDSSSNSNNNYYIPNLISSPSESILAMQKKKLLEKKQAKYNHKGNHNYKTIISEGSDIITSKNGNDNQISNSRLYGKSLGEQPIQDDLQDWFQINKPELLLKQSKENSLDNLIYGTNSNKICNKGVISTTTPITNTCKGDTCYINEMQCNGKNITITNTTPYDSSINYDNCQIFSIYCPKSTQVVKIFDFQELYGLKQCNTKKFECSELYLGDCVIEDLVCDGNTQFGEEMFAFECLNNRLLCDGIIIPSNKYQDYNESIKNGSCVIQQYPCETTTELLLNLTITCDSNNSNCTLNKTTSSASLKCSRNLPFQTCECPLDYYGELCQKSVPIICELNIESPKPNCTGSDYILADSHCFTYTQNDSPQFKFNLDCFLAISNNIPKYKFNYWINKPNLKISDPVKWAFSSEYINFYRLYNTSMRNEFVLTKDQISGVEPITFNSDKLSSIDSQYFVAKRIYAELALITPTSSSVTTVASSSSSGSSSGGAISGNTNTATLSKFFIYVLDYPITAHPSPSMSKVKLALIIVGSFLAFVLLVAAFVFYRNKLKVN